MSVLSVIGAVVVVVLFWFLAIFAIDTKGPLMKYALAGAAGLMILYFILNTWVL